MRVFGYLLIAAGVVWVLMCFVGIAMMSNPSTCSARHFCRRCWDLLQWVADTGWSDGLGIGQHRPDY